MAATQSQLPTRTMSNSDDDAVPGEDTSEVTKLFQERLQAYKHACGYLEDYVKATEKLQDGHGKEYEKVLKTVSSPLKEGHHFDQQLGGIAGMFDNIRTNTQGISNSHHETAMALKGQILPIFERLHAEIKNKNKELTKGAGKQAKVVDKARNATQKHIELLGTHTASYSSAGGNVHADKDPYLLQRGVMHRLNKQIIEENNNRSDLLAVQNNFQQFEGHVIETFQQGLAQFLNVVQSQSEKDKVMYGDMVGIAQRIAPNVEWNGFVKRNNNMLIDPSAPARDISNVSFPNQNHASTQPLIAGSLERKGKLLKRTSAGYYVVTPSGYLHEFDTDNNFAKDPSPENSLYLPDCSVGYLDGQKFTVKGKDVSKGKIPGVKGISSHEFTFKAHTAQDANAWYDIIRKQAGQTTNEKPTLSEPSSPAMTKQSGEFGETSAAPAADVRAGEASDLGQTTGTTTADTTVPGKAL